MHLRVGIGAALALAALSCGGGTPGSLSFNGGGSPRAIAPGGDDQSRCDWRGRADREVSETAGPGAVTPNVRRVFQLVGPADDRHKVLVCREIDTNLDGRKDTVRFYNEKGEPLREESDTSFDGKIDVWTVFAGGHIAKDTVDTDFDGQPDEWKYYIGGVLSRIQRDTNRDGKPDRWEFYTSGKLERMGVDLDFDGHVDRWDHDEIARQQAEATAKAEAAAKAASVDGGAGSAAGAPATAPTAAPENPDEAAPDAGTKLVSSRPKRQAKDGGADAAEHD